VSGRHTEIKPKADPTPWSQEIVPSAQIQMEFVIDENWAEQISHAPNEGSTRPYNSSSVMEVADERFHPVAPAQGDPRLDKCTEG